MHMQHARIYNLRTCLYTVIRQHWYIGECFCDSPSGGNVAIEFHSKTPCEPCQVAAQYSVNESCGGTCFEQFLERDLVGGSLMFIVFLNRLSYLVLPLPGLMTHMLFFFFSVGLKWPSAGLLHPMQPFAAVEAAGCCRVRKDVSHRTGDFAVARIKSFKIVQVCEWMIMDVNCH